MDNIFYSHDEKILFWVAGYTADNNTDDLLTIIGSLTENANIFAGMAKCALKDVKTYQITNSRRYKYMRVFYTKTDYIPPAAFVIGDTENKWTMQKWLND